MIRAAFFYILSAASLVAAGDPRAVAERAIGAWRDGNANILDAISHPELKARFRHARIVEFYVEDKPEKRKRLESGTDAEVVALVCEALRAIVPGRDKVAHVDVFVKSEIKGEYAVVSFDSTSSPKGGTPSHQTSTTEVLLKKDGSDWKFLWSAAVQLHVDLQWKPSA
jgi:hypothetical protein